MRLALLIFSIFNTLIVSAGMNCRYVLQVREKPVWSLGEKLFAKLQHTEQWQEEVWKLKSKKDLRAAALEKYIENTLRFENIIDRETLPGAAKGELVTFANGIKAIQKRDVSRFNNTRGSAASYIFDVHLQHLNRFPMTFLRYDADTITSMQIYIPNMRYIQRLISRREISDLTLFDLINDDLDRFREDFEDEIVNLKALADGRFVPFDGGQSHFGAHHSTLAKEAYESSLGEKKYWSFRLRRCCKGSDGLIDEAKENGYLRHLFGDEAPQHLEVYQNINVQALVHDMQEVLTPTEIERFLFRLEHFVYRLDAFPKYKEPKRFWNRFRH